ncbi:hypothetical protein DL98DRAFT_521236 [Cadophora sp. DSE1049]|nr:hypothetical protein DL98DRAFT_521236 [Cadophora sp. DSE1049]
MLKDNSWDAPEAVELPAWWKTLSKCDIPATAINLFIYIILQLSTYHSHAPQTPMLFQPHFSRRTSATDLPRPGEVQLVGPWSLDF